jgi:hypothetical protein
LWGEVAWVAKLKLVARLCALPCWRLRWEGTLLLPVCRPCRFQARPPCTPPLVQSLEYLRAHAKAHAPELLLALEESKAESKSSSAGGSGGWR